VVTTWAADSVKTDHALCSSAGQSEQLRSVYGSWSRRAYPLSALGDSLELSPARTLVAPVYVQGLTNTAAAANCSWRNSLALVTRATRGVAYCLQQPLTPSAIPAVVAGLPPELLERRRIFAPVKHACKAANADLGRSPGRPLSKHFQLEAASWAHRVWALAAW